MVTDNLNYGIIGNGASGALISRDGSVDWLCLPHFASPSVFAKILDPNAGSLGIKVKEDVSIKQSYLENTNILKTHFETDEWAFEILDFMPRYQKVTGSYYYPPELTRIIKPLRGTPEFVVEYNPRLEYSKDETITHNKGTYLISILENEEQYDALYLYANIPFGSIINRETITLSSTVFITISYNEKLDHTDLEKAWYDFDLTKAYWLNWVQRTKEFSYYNKEIRRSALTLKLLSYDKTGAIIAALTTSLPETIGEVRNWDYRFCWIRDSSMVIKILSQLGHRKIVRRFIDYIIDLIPEKDEKLQIMYGIHSEQILTEETLEHLSGYHNSKPVRIGNDAYHQKQNDIYGILMDAIYVELEQFSNDFERKEELWEVVKNIVWIVSHNWEKPDKGIWEFRGEDKHFTFSKVLCWVALDRAIKIAQLLNKNKPKWYKVRDQIKEQIEEKAWNDEVHAYTQYYGSTALDASVLLMEQYGFIDPNDPRFVATVKSTERELLKDGLMYRYKNEDDFGEPSSSFTICTFWFIRSLIKIGEVEQAKKYFNQLLTYSNHLGLFSEDIDFKTKRLLGNFPQAYSHLALIDTAIQFNKVFSI
ncbi:MAG: Trehalase [Flavobacteriaceae bacterium]|nr:glycoside hydrolase family 15 protein [Flavobacteriaceae bacterium]CAI8184459.1 MAG: Trehalase [Flavobacteriaceae bacterium]